MNDTIKYYVGEFVRNLTYSIYTFGTKSRLGKCIESLFAKVMSLNGLSYYPIVSVQKYMEDTNNVTIKTIVDNRVGFEGNVVYDDEEYKPELKPQKLLNIRLQIYNDVCVTGNSDMIVDTKRACIINDACYNIAPEVLFIDGLLYRDKKNVGVLRSNMRHFDETIECGIMINGKFSQNYYHTITENLIRLLVVNELDISNEVPLLVDEKVRLVPSMSRILNIKKKKNKPVIYLQPTKTYCVKQLYYVDHINKLVPHIKGINTQKSGIVAFDRSYMTNLRDILLDHISNKKTPKRIFLTRKNTNHRNYNENEVFSVLAPFGFEQVAPEEYSFEEQMALFHNAEWIVGGSGAAFTNLIFCSKGCNVVIFRSIRNKNTSPLFSTLAYFNEVKIIYYLPTQSGSSTSIHSDYEIDTTLFGEYIKAHI